jgi:hypothetical protein
VASSRLDELAAKVDGFFARVAERHPDDLQCHTGCSDCCHVRLTVTGVEAAAIRALVAAWPAEQRAAVAANLTRGGDDDATRCAALDATGRCLIYAARPLVCRSHGAPIRLRDERSLPVILACFRNFTRGGPAAADADCILDQTTLSALLLAVERASGQASGELPRVDLAALLGELC